jgi:hypothetical protein
MAGKVVCANAGNDRNGKAANPAASRYGFGDDECIDASPGCGARHRVGHIAGSRRARQWHAPHKAALVQTIGAVVVFPLTDTTGTTLRSNKRAVATTGVRSAARPAQMMGDRCRQVSWLAAHAHRLRLPAGCPAVALGATLAAYSCGGSRGVEEKPLAPRSLFTHRDPTGAEAGPSRAIIEAKRQQSCQQLCSPERQFAIDRCLRSSSGVSPTSEKTEQRRLFGCDELRGGAEKRSGFLTILFATSFALLRRPRHRSPQMRPVARRRPRKIRR